MTAYTQDLSAALDAFIDSDRATFERLATRGYMAHGQKFKDEIEYGLKFLAALAA